MALCAPGPPATPFLSRIAEMLSNIRHSPLSAPRCLPPHFPQSGRSEYGTRLRGPPALSRS
eukprot:932232-Rhodomonas_salina.1